MANKVKISKNSEGGACLVQAISIKKGEELLYVPSPFGNESMVFDNVEEAIKRIEQCGYEYYFSDKQSGKMQPKNAENKIDYDEIIDVLIKNLGHENLEIRNSAINALSKFGIDIADKLSEILQYEKRWLAQQSIVKCIEKIISNDKKTISVFLPQLIKISESDNTLVKSAALKAIEKICDYRNEQ